jgi:hypothetical protein
VAHDTDLQLPVLVSSPSDIGRLTRELEALNEALMQLELRQPGQEVKLPKTSLLLDKITAQNELNLLHKEERQRLLKFLQTVRKQAPLLHISFNADPTAGFMEKLVAWLRKEIHPHVLVTIGLQPNLGVGCIVRSGSRQFDFSLRQNFARKRDVLAGLLSAREPAV